jgi:hypothetical protein
MPNWVHNSMKITGAAKEIARFKQTCLRAADPDDEEFGPVARGGVPLVFDFNTVIPMPLDSTFRDDPMPLDLSRPYDEEQKVAYEEWKVRDAERLIQFKAVTGFDNPGDWAWKHWGTPKQYAFWLEVHQDEAKCFDCSFDTAWSPPIPVWEKIGELFPTLTFQLGGCEPLNDYAFRGTIKRGKLRLRDVPLMWETTEPKTGKQVRGTREEIDTALGDKGGAVTYSIGDTH